MTEDSITPDQPVLNGPGELIAALPLLLGFEPRESVVLVSIREHGRLGVVLRVDRADCEQPHAAAALGRALAAHLGRDDAGLAVAVSYTEEDVKVSCPAVAALRPFLAEAVGEVEEWAVSGGRYFAPGCAQEGCCPAGGRPLPPPQKVSVALGRVRGPGHAPRTGLALDKAPEADRRRAAAAGRRWWSRREAGLEAWRVQSLARWRSLLSAVGGAGEVPVVEAGKVIESLQDRWVRDAVLVSMIPGWADEGERMLRGGGRARVEQALAVLISPQMGQPPQHAHVDPVVELCAHLTALATRTRTAPLLTLRAVIAWWQGDGSGCEVLLRAAHRAEPGYRLAGLLECTVLAGLEPGWMRVA